MEIKNKRIQALAQHLDVGVEDLQEDRYNEQLILYGSQEYLVVTDDEADVLWDENLDNYLEDCVYPDLPGNMKSYFDDEAWKSDARMDGRGHSLSYYDGCEDCETVEDEDYYIYRQN